jgi:anthranilate phosphoribosyltransferase
VLENQAGPPRDIVIFNTAAALYAANVADTIEAGIAKSRAAIESGAAKAKLEQLIKMSKTLAA